MCQRHVWKRDWWQRDGWHALTKGKGVALASTMPSGSTASHEDALDSRATHVVRQYFTGAGVLQSPIRVIREIRVISDSKQLITTCG